MYFNVYATKGFGRYLENYAIDEVHVRQYIILVIFTYWLIDLHSINYRLTHFLGYVACLTDKSYPLARCSRITSCVCARLISRTAYVDKILKNSQLFRDNPAFGHGKKAFGRIHRWRVLENVIFQMHSPCFHPCLMWSWLHMYMSNLRDSFMWIKVNWFDNYRWHYNKSHTNNVLCQFVCLLFLYNFDFNYLFYKLISFYR